jgi:ABC-type lipoprotein release transport system permease subunit
VQALAILGIAIGVMAMLVVMSVMNGLIDINRESIQSTQGDLHLSPVASVAQKELALYEKALSDVEQIEAITPRLTAYAMYSIPGYYTDYSNSMTANQNGIQIIGIDLEREQKVTDFSSLLNNAKIFPAKDIESAFQGTSSFPRPGIIISDLFLQKLPPVKQLDLGALPAFLPKKGEKLTPHNATVEITSSYAAANFRNALDVVFMERTGINGLRYNLLGNQAPEFTEILIKIKPSFQPTMPIELVKNQIIASLEKYGIDTAPNKGFKLETWEEKSALLLTAIDNERRMVGIILMFVIIVSIFGLFASLSSLVREKTKDLGVLAALGYSPVARAELMILTGNIASGLGCGLGWLGAKSFYENRKPIIDFLRDKWGIELFSPDLYVVSGLPARWIDDQAQIVVILSLVLGLLFTLIPAMRAAYLSPIKALRHES